MRVNADLNEMGGNLEVEIVLFFRFELAQQQMFSPKFYEGEATAERVGLLSSCQ